MNSKTRKKGNRNLEDMIQADSSKLKQEEISNEDEIDINYSNDKKCLFVIKKRKSRSYDTKLILNDNNLDDHIDSLDFDNKNKDMKGKSNSDMIDCSICSKTMKVSSYKCHLNTHYGVKFFSCPVCLARFSRKGDAIRHHVNAHQKNKNKNVVSLNEIKKQKNLLPNLYICSLCGFKCDKKETFDGHMDYVHSKQDLNVQTLLPDERNRVKELNTEIAELEFANFVKSEVGEFNGDFHSSVKKEPLDNSPDLINELNIEVQSSSNDSQDSNDPIETYLNEISINKNVVSLNRKFGSQHIYSQKQNLIDSMINDAALKSKRVLAKIQASVNKKSPISIINSQSGVSQIAVVPQRVNELQIRANINGADHSYLVEAPYCDIDGNSELSRNAVINLVNDLFTGKGELQGPVEVVMQKKIQS